MKRGGNSSLAHVLVLDTDPLSGERKGKTEQCFVNPILEATYLKASMLVHLAAWR